MLTSSAWLHLRIPFSYFLLPVFLFSLAISPNIAISPLLWTFLTIHFFLYPASNGYNSYFDKDEKSIGGLKNPPPVSKGLYYLSLLFDGLAIVLGFLKVSFLFAALLLIYGLISKAYSHPAIRLKKYPVASWLVVGLFQGLFTFIMCYVGINRYPIETTLKATVLIPGVLTTLQLLGTYPMTQIYQHEEDAKRGDRTFSLMLGIRGTFYFVAAIFTFVTVAFVVYFYYYFGVHYAIIFPLALSPVVVYFGYWFFQVYRNPEAANYGHTMRLNFISATCLNGFFIYLFLQTTHILDAFN